MDVVDGVIVKGNVDINNLFIIGGFGGGVLIVWFIGKIDCFVVVVVVKLVINWMSFVFIVDVYFYFNQYWMLGMFWDIFEYFWKYFLLLLVGNVMILIMLLIGEVDYCIFISEFEQFYQVLKFQGVDVVMLCLLGVLYGIVFKFF